MRLARHRAGFLHHGALGGTRAPVQSSGPGGEATGGWFSGRMARAWIRSAAAEAPPVMDVEWTCESDGAYHAQAMQEAGAAPV